jgi:hypothetical protein
MQRSFIEITDSGEHDGPVVTGCIKQLTWLPTTYDTGGLDDDMHVAVIHSQNDTGLHTQIYSRSGTSLSAFSVSPAIPMAEANGEDTGVPDLAHPVACGEQIKVNVSAGNSLTGKLLIYTD